VLNSDRKVLLKFFSKFGRTKDEDGALTDDCDYDDVELTCFVKQRAGSVIGLCGVDARGQAW